MRPDASLRPADDDDHRRRLPRCAGPRTGEYAEQFLPVRGDADQQLIDGLGSVHPFRTVRPSTFAAFSSRLSKQEKKTLSVAESWTIRAAASWTLS